MSDAEARAEHASAQTEAITPAGYPALEGELQARQDEIDRLRQLLVAYGRHNEGCSAQ
jgi:hypothetical protein